MTADLHTYVQLRRSLNTWEPQQLLTTTHTHTHKLTHSLSLSVDGIICDLGVLRGQGQTQAPGPGSGVRLRLSGQAQGPGSRLQLCLVFPNPDGKAGLGATRSDQLRSFWLLWLLSTVWHFNNPAELFSSALMFL